MITRPIGDDDIHAYVDGQLDLARRAEIEAWLAENPEAAARAAFYARSNEALHQSFDPVLAEPVPAEMSTPKRRRFVLPWRSAAVAASFALIGLAGGWFAHGAFTEPVVVERLVAVPQPMPTQAALAHSAYASEVRHPVEVGADEEAHLVRWLTNRMGKPVKAPKLEAMGYRLMGGRLLPAQRGRQRRLPVHVRECERHAHHAVHPHAERQPAADGVPLRDREQRRRRVLLDRPQPRLRAVGQHAEGRSAAPRARNLRPAHFISAATPGSSLPSSHSRKAPPAVET